MQAHLSKDIVANMPANRSDVPKLWNAGEIPSFKKLDCFM
jgi:hypothetical protein